MCDKFVNILNFEGTAKRNGRYAGIHASLEAVLADVPEPPKFCRSCARAIVKIPSGWTHVDARGLSEGKPCQPSVAEPK